MTISRAGSLGRGRGRRGQGWGATPTRKASTVAIFTELVYHKSDNVPNVTNVTMLPM